MFHIIYNYNDILIFIICQVEVSCTIFYHRFRVCAILVFLVTICLGSQIIPHLFYSIFNLQNHP